MRRRLLAGHLLPLYCSTLSFFPSFSNFRSSFVIARVSDLLLSFLRATHGWGWLPFRNGPTKNFETIAYGLGTLSFFTTKHKPNDAH
jgi:hypothetical protein